MSTVAFTVLGVLVTSRYAKWGCNRPFRTVQAGIGALTLGQEPSEDWLAASPDGLIQDVPPGTARHNEQPVQHAYPRVLVWTTRASASCCMGTCVWGGLWAAWQAATAHVRMRPGDWLLFAMADSALMVV